MARVSAIERRRQLVEAAFRVIGAEGFAAATTRRICAEAGAPVAAFHYCFASKEELFVELTEATVGALVEAQAGGVLVRGSVRESLRATLREYWATVEADPNREVVLTGLTQYALHEPSLAGVARRQYAAYHRTAGLTLTSLASGCGVSWTLPVEELARMLVVVTDGVVIAWLVDRDGAAARAALDAFADALAGFAVRGPTPPVLHDDDGCGRPDLVAELRTVDVAEVEAVVAELCVEANHELRADHVAALQRGRAAEESPIGREVFDRLLENARVSVAEQIAFCQDTGYAVVFLTVGQDVHFTGGSLAEAIDRGVAQGYRDGYLRASLVRSPVDRVNTGDNTPAMVHYDLVPGSAIELTLLVKGAGCDNMSALRMLTPAAGVDGMKRFVVETIEKAGPSASPPVTVGIGMGGTFDRAAVLAKRALTRDPTGSPSPDPKLAELEAELVDAINATGIGPAGFGGTVTTVAVHVEAYPTHIAAFPVAINLDCHSHRVRSVTL